MDLQLYERQEKCFEELSAAEWNWMLENEQNLNMWLFLRQKKEQE